MRLDLRSLRDHRDFRLFFLGQFVSLLGSWMQGIAQAWLVYRLSGSELTLGLVATLQNLPALLLGPAAGWVADRFPRRTTILLTHVLSMLQAIVLAWLTLTDRITVPHILVLAVVFGVSNAFEMPSRQTLVTDLVGRADLPNAIALNSSMMNLTRILGPAVAGIIVASVGEGVCFSINAVSFLAAIGTLVVLKVPARMRPRSLAGPLRQMVEGLRYVRGRKPVSGLLLLLGVGSFMAMPQLVLMPVFAKSLGAIPVLGWTPGGPRALGILQAALGIGALSGALTLASRRGVAGFGRIVAGSGLLQGIAIVVFAASNWLPVSTLLLVPIGFGAMRMMIGTNTLLQSMVPDEIRGRVMSFYSMMLVGISPFASMLAGALAEAFGARPTVLLFGVAGASACAYARLRIPALRAEASAMLAEAGADVDAAPEATGPATAPVPAHAPVDAQHHLPH